MITETGAGWGVLGGTMNGLSDESNKEIRQTRKSCKQISTNPILSSYCFNTRGFLPRTFDLSQT